MRLGPIGILVIVATIGLAGCESDADRIRSLNEDPNTLSAEIDAIDIEEGDCINSTLPEGVDIESVVIVPCSGSWQYRAVGSFDVPNANQYPGDEYFERQAYERCDARYTSLLIPLEESWGLGGREVTCLQESFGLSATDSAKLDRLTGIEGLGVGDCFNEAPETGGLLVERVDCSSAWESRVLRTFQVEASEPFPGQASFDKQAYETCDHRYTTNFSPNEETWAMGDRTIICLQESFGLSVTEPAKLERLIGIEGLKVGDCFNEAPETDHLLVERVDCSGAWESRVEGRFSVSLNGEYPGEAYLQAQATLECGSSSNYYYWPSPELWVLGDRAVTCVKNS